MKKLTGSEKQIEWADAIRNDFLKNIPVVIERALEKIESIASKSFSEKYADRRQREIARNNQVISKANELIDFINMIEASTILINAKGFVVTGSICQVEDLYKHFFNK